MAHLSTLLIIMVQARMFHFAPRVERFARPFFFFFFFFFSTTYLAMLSKQVFQPSGRPSTQKSSIALRRYSVLSNVTVCLVVVRLHRLFNAIFARNRHLRCLILGNLCDKHGISGVISNNGDLVEGVWLTLG